MTDIDGLAKLRRSKDRTIALFVRNWPYDRATLWTELTDPARLPHWLAPGEIELREGGAARLNFADSGAVIDSVVSAFDPGLLIEYSWSGPGEPLRPVRWELDPVGAGTTVTLTLQIPAGEDSARACAGWHAHLEMLAAALEGVPIKFPFDLFKATRDAYRALAP